MSKFQQQIKRQVRTLYVFWFETIYSLRVYRYELLIILSVVEPRGTFVGVNNEWISLYIAFDLCVFLSHSSVVELTDTRLLIQK